MYSKDELINIFEAAGLAIPTFALCGHEWECTWDVDDEDRHDEADEIQELLSETKLRGCKVYTTISKVIIYVD